LKYLEITRTFKVVYDDKNDEKIDLTKELFLIEDQNLKN
jgi:hypothetical protein